MMRANHPRLCTGRHLHDLVVVARVGGFCLSVVLLHAISLPSDAAFVKYTP